MPEYGFQCYEEDGGCGTLFEIKCSMDEIVGKNPTCPNCKKRKPVNRNFRNDIHVFDATPRTVGALAERNGSKMSSDEIQSLKSKYLQKPKFTGSLPDGGSLMPDKE